jgi:hypothetical protein
MALIGQAEVCAALGCKKSKASMIINDLQKELRNMGYLTYRGKIPEKYFRERYMIDEKDGAGC